MSIFSQTINSPMSPIEESSDFENYYYTISNNYPFSIGNMDSTLGLQTNIDCSLGSFKIDRIELEDETDNLHMIYENDNSLALIKSDPPLEEEEHLQQEDSEEFIIDNLKDNLNLIRDLNYSRKDIIGKRRKSSNKKKNIKYSKQAEFYHKKTNLKGNRNNLNYDGNQFGSVQKSNLDLPTPPSTNSTNPVCLTSSASSSLSTPPATPILKSSLSFTSQPPKTKRSDLLLNKNSKLDIPKVPIISSAQQFNEYKIVVRFFNKKDNYVNYIMSIQSSSPLYLAKITNKLVPLSVMKLDPRYILKNSPQQQQQEENSNLKFNLDFVKTLSNSKKDRYYSRLNIFELAKVLELDDYDISLTKEIEINILEIFKHYCNFKLGYQTWIRDTTKQQRVNLINLLFNYTSTYYPEFNKFKLEVIVRRGSYSLMQSRLRKERRLKG